MDIDVKNLHPLEVRVLRHVGPNEEITTARIIEELGYILGQCNQAFSWLHAKGYLAEKSRITRTFFELTELGEQQAQEGMAAHRIFAHLKAEGPKTLPELAAALNLENSDVGSAFGQLSKAKAAAMGEGKRATAVAEALEGEFVTFETLLKKGADALIEESSLSAEEQQAMAKISKKRSATNVPFKVIEREEIIWELTESGAAAKQALVSANITGDEVGQVTAELLASGKWREATFRPYVVDAPTARITPGRLNPYASYLTWVKDKLTSLGFEEFDGPLVESEFWNGDALFMPQFHSARDIHDVYYVKEPSHRSGIEEPWLSQVAQTHEDGWTTGSRGWQYSFDRDFTLRQVLRSQGTVLSAKQLTDAKVPGKYFGIVRCFRYDQVDATHGADFYQTEGIVLGDEVNLKTLLGLLKMFAEEIAGAEEVKYVPAYFPFTEPSIEVHIKHPVLGWFELGGSGIFRPEVTQALGIDVPVLAWGLGIDRMALMHLGLNDLRDLFSANIEAVRTRREN
ncbi:MAG TPA: phenylalanine--tRNA ligase subunit alpha [Sphaerochaeta sp.]|nr:phenylalanine--tRNA ligase subunit alpha [Sphaerochaeta sp.]